jgi:hypothetical protein
MISINTKEFAWKNGPRFARFQRKKKIPIAKIWMISSIRQPII